jgi:hypothetical protein
MAVVRIVYDVLTSAAAELRKEQAEISVRIETVKSLIDGLAENESCGPRASARVGEFGARWSADAQETAGRLSGLAALLCDIVDGYRNFDGGLLGAADAVLAELSERPANPWEVLDLDGDPTAGDLHQVRALAEDMRSRAERSARCAGDLRAATDAIPRHDGDRRLRELMDELRIEWTRLETAHRTCADALSELIDHVEQAKAQAHAALARGAETDIRHQSTVREFCRFLSVSALPGGDRRALNEAMGEELTRDLTPEVREHALRIAVRAGDLEVERHHLRHAAVEAGRLRDEAVSRCAQAIRSAMAGDSDGGPPAPEDA